MKKRKLKQMIETLDANVNRLLRDLITAHEEIAALKARIAELEARPKDVQVIEIKKDVPTIPPYYRDPYWWEGTGGRPVWPEYPTIICDGNSGYDPNTHTVPVPSNWTYTA